ncbi:MAG TPA: ATP-binding protein [Mycobacteriales bacterium]|jgi:signal transduction histidine kinase|nr:ATP-binding protein [Mycobacteriales bacterium]
MTTDPVSLAARRARRAAAGAPSGDVAARLAALLVRDPAAVPAEVAAIAAAAGARQALVLAAADGVLRPVAAFPPGAPGAAAAPVVATRALLDGELVAWPAAWPALEPGATLVPLRAGGAAHGLLAVDGPAPGPGLVEVLVAFAAAALAATAADAERARAGAALAALATVTAALAAATDAAGVAAALAAAGLGSVAVRDHGVVLDGARGVAEADLPAPLAAAFDGWAADPRPVALAGGDTVGYPVLARGAVRGAVLVPAPVPEAADAAARALAVAAGATLARIDLERRLRRQRTRVAVLTRLHAVLDGATGATVVARLNDLLAPTGDEVVALRLRGRRAAPVEEGAVALPLRSGRRVVGDLVVRPVRRDDDAVAFLEAVAAGVAEHAARAAARERLEEAARDRAVAAERDRIAADLHDSVGQLFVGIGLLARRAADELPADSPWAQRFARLTDISREGKWAIDDAVRALAFVPARRGLVDSLRALARSVGADSGIDVAVRADGRARRLPAEAEQALFRVAHQALANAWRHARCTAVGVEVAYEPGAVRVRVRDDGVGLGQRPPDTSAGFGMSTMRRAVAGVGGTLRVANEEPHGVLVEARVPVGAR